MLISNLDLVSSTCSSADKANNGSGCWRAPAKDNSVFIVKEGTMKTWGKTDSIVKKMHDIQCSPSKALTGPATVKNYSESLLNKLAFA
jgi:hypothetical protein